MNITLDNCPLCKAKGPFKQRISCVDYTVSKERFSLAECSSCSFLFTNPRPDDESIGSYYKSEEYVSHNNKAKGIINKLYYMVRSFTLKQKLKLVEAHVSRGTILDYGCGTGMFLSTCKDSGWNCYGMEPDAQAREISVGGGTKAFADKKELKQALGEQKLDAITLWHVLEHVTDLENTLAFFKENLSSNGVLIVAVPNHKSYDAVKYGEFWAAYDVPRHIYHFDSETMRNLMGRFGFMLVQMRPMKFDSFYVSMLSEKYKTGSINYFKAFFTGLLSNLKAKAPKDYSSVIYVFKQA